MRRIGDNRARHTPRPSGIERAGLPIQRNAPRNRPTPVMASDDELLHMQRIGQCKDIGGQLVRRIGAHLLRF